MGPNAYSVADALGAGELESLGYFRHRTCEIAGIEGRAARLSYVGEPGWEITCAKDHALTLCNAILEQDVAPAGLFAQTAMRIEKGYLSYGHDLDTDDNPLQAGLEFAVAWESDFIGKAALQHIKDGGPDRRMVSIVLDDRQANPLGNEPVYLGDQIIGQTTSAAFGYRVGRPVALGYVDADIGGEGVRVEIDIARRLFSGTIRFGPVYQPPANQ